MNHKKLKESIIDKTRSSLDKNIIGKDNNDNYIVLPEIETFIYDEVSKVYDISKLNEFFIKGSSLTYEWLPQSDIDIYLVDASLSDEDLDDLRQIIVRPFNKEHIPLFGTEHPLEIYIDNVIYAKYKADAMWDLLEHKWIKGPSSISADISKYWEKFKTTVDTYENIEDELYRDVVDYELLQKLLKDAYPEEKQDIINQLKGKLEEIEASLDEAQIEFQSIKDMRHAVFDPDIPVEYEILLKELKSRNLLPDNVVFKLAQRYFYLAFLKMLKDLGEEESTTDTKVDDIKNIFKAKSNYLDTINNSLKIDMDCLFLSETNSKDLFVYLEGEYSELFNTIDNLDEENILLESKMYGPKIIEEAYRLFMDVQRQYPSVIIKIKFPTREE